MSLLIEIAESSCTARWNNDDRTVFCGKLVTIHVELVNRVFSDHGQWCETPRPTAEPKCDGFAAMFS